MEYEFDVLFLGAGPAGYVGAIRARQLGLKAAVVEKDKAGGVCLNVGCIPSKALIEQASRFRTLEDLCALGVRVDLSAFEYASVQDISRTAADKLSKGVQFLLKKNGVEYFSGLGRLVSARSVKVTGADGPPRVVSAAAVVVATGSRPKSVPPFTFDGERVLSSTDILMLQRLPKRMAILGAGAIGMEFAFIMNAFGVEVEVVEMLDRILPMEDADSAALIRSSLEKRGVIFHTATRATGLEGGKGGRLSLTIAPAVGEGAGDKIAADTLLVAVGRTPNTENLGLQELGIKLDRGYVNVGDYYESAAAGIYAVGDIVAGEAQLAHLASAQAELVAERVAFLRGLGPAPHRRRVDGRLVPQAVYCEPQAASFGLKEEFLKMEGRPYRSVSFPFRGIGKAVAVGHSDGFIKILSDPSTGELLGAAAAGGGATELIHELLLAASAELTAEEIAAVVHAHPTLSEGVKEAALASLGRALHI